MARTRRRAKRDRSKGNGSAFTSEDLNRRLIAVLFGPFGRELAESDALLARMRERREVVIERRLSGRLL
ncbi:MAG: hypothetical protein ACHQPI_11095 [Thermoanaerobaculia bacterium]